MSNYLDQENYPGEEVPVIRVDHQTRKGISQDGFAIRRYTTGGRRYSRKKSAVANRRKKTKETEVRVETHGVIENQPRSICIVRGNFHQGAEIFLPGTRGKQCTANAAVSIAMAAIINPTDWTPDIMNSILFLGDDLYQKSMDSRNAVHEQEIGCIDYLTPEELLSDIRIQQYLCKFSLGEVSFGPLFATDGPSTRENVDGLLSLENFLQQNQNSGILTCFGSSLAILNINAQCYIFDSHSRDVNGRISANGSACLLRISNSHSLYETVKMNWPQNASTQVRDIGQVQYQFTAIDIHVTDCSLPESILDAHQSINDTLNGEDEPEPTSDPGAACSTIRSSSQGSFELPEHVEEVVPDPQDFLEVDEEGKSIVSMKHVWNMTRNEYVKHRAIHGCDILDFQFVKAVPKGLKHFFRFKCDNCHTEYEVTSVPETDDNLDINKAAVIGCVTIGIGFSQLEEFFGILNMRFMSNRLYQRCFEEITPIIKGAAEDSMAKYAEEERELAFERGHVVDGIPYTSVDGDGSYIKRSYINGRYDSSGCCLAIIGGHTQKVIQIIVKQKTCSVCDRAQSGNYLPKVHECSRNHDRTRSSTSMESCAMADAFEKSIEKTGLIYAFLVSDGDSANHKSVVDRNPYARYGVGVENILCSNHIKRNISNSIKTLGRTKGQIGVLRKKFVDRILPLLNALENSIQKIKQFDCSHDEKCAKLKADILILPYHACGEHSQCVDTAYECVGPRQNEENLVPQMHEKNLFFHFEQCLARAFKHASSLLYDVNTNTVEQFNSQIAKTIGAKRIDFALRFSYSTRCYAAVLKQNEGQSYSLICKKAGVNVPLIGWRLQLMRFHANIRKCVRNRENEYVRPSRGTENTSTDQFYGPRAEEAELSDAEKNLKKQEHYAVLRAWLNDRVAIEERTRDQNPFGEWMTKKRWTITATKAHSIIRRQAHTSCGKIVKSILYPICASNNPAMAHGRKYEEVAREALKNYGLSVQKCRLIFDPEILGVGASPDGIIQLEDRVLVVEIKCPYKGRNKPVHEAMKSKDCPISRAISWNGETPHLKPTHEYYTQMQLQMRVTGAFGGVFVVLTLVDWRMIVVDRNQDFIDQMLPKLVEFYDQCIVPEIIDPQAKKNKPIKDPHFILEAQAARSQAIIECRQAGHDGSLMIEERSLIQHQEEFVLEDEQMIDSAENHGQPVLQYYIEDCQMTWHNNDSSSD